MRTQFDKKTGVWTCKVYVQSGIRVIERIPLTAITTYEDHVAAHKDHRLGVGTEVRPRLQPHWYRNLDDAGKQWKGGRHAVLRASKRQGDRAEQRLSACTDFIRTIF